MLDSHTRIKAAVDTLIEKGNYARTVGCLEMHLTFAINRLSPEKAEEQLAVLENTANTI